MIRRFLDWWRTRIVLLDSVETLVSFGVLDFSAREQVRALLEQMQERPWSAAGNTTGGCSRRMNEARIFSSVDNALIAIFRELVRDDERLKRTSAPPLGWHFEVIRDPENIDHLMVHTCLTTEGRTGATRYGRTVRRLSANEYAVWFH